jgi:hypothetical protein
VVVTAKVGPFTAMESFALAVNGVGVLESVAVTVKDVVPITVGVPVMTPLLPLSARPAGSFPVVTDQNTGGVPPLADKPAE